jgi:hypothetical protein
MTYPWSPSAVGFAHTRTARDGLPTAVALHHSKDRGGMQAMQRDVRVIVSKASHTTPDYD